MSTSTNWPRDRLDRFWALQKRARDVDLKLTADPGGKLHLRTSQTATSLVDIDEAEAVIVDAEKAGEPT